MMFNQLRQSIRKYFGISRFEANGILVLLVITAALVLSPLAYRNWPDERYPLFETDSIRLDSLIGLWYNNPEDLISSPGKGKNWDSVFEFDPNQVTFDQMILLGFDTLLAKRLLKFRKLGGTFVAKEDLLRIYDLPDSMFQRLKDHIQLPEKALMVQSTTSDYPPEIQDGWDRNDLLATGTSRVLGKWSLDINSADTSDYMRIRGIGPILSRRIIKYRELLGGYSNINQLDSVYGLKDEVLQYLKSVAYIDSMFKPVTIKVNYGTWVELVRHPYINRQLASDIIHLRSEKGYLMGEDDLRNIPYISDSMLIRLRPYLEF